MAGLIDHEKRLSHFLIRPHDTITAIRYFQLSLCGVAGEVVIGNALCDERRRVLLTPGHYLGNWSLRLHSLRKKAA